MLAKNMLAEVKENDRFWQIKIKGYKHYLFYSKELPLRSLYQPLAEQLYPWQWHYYQIPQTQIKKDDIVFDCGAAEGIFTFLNFQQAKHIYAFEPLPEYFAGLKQTFKDVRNVTVLNLALGEKYGTAFLKKAGLNSSLTSEKTPYEVIVETIDHFCLKNKLKPSYIKADLEGYELNLLKGATETIKKYKPRIAITTYHEETHASAIKEFLLALNPAYNILTKGIEERKGAPVMLHAW
jgi:FkbM family methyltransferase